MFCKTVNVSVASPFTPMHKASEQTIPTVLHHTSAVIWETSYRLSLYGSLYKKMIIKKTFS